MQNINKINEDLNLIDYTINSLVEENAIENNSEMINEMYELGISIKQKLSSLETTIMFKSKEDAYDMSSNSWSTWLILEVSKAS